MARLIDADAIISFVDAGHLRNPMELSWSDKDVVDMIESRPTIDAVPVVRCRECKHNNGEKVWLDGDITIDCANGIGYPPPDWFCADGERKDGENEETV